MWGAIGGIASVLLPAIVTARGQAMGNMPGMDSVPAVDSMPGMRHMPGMTMGAGPLGVPMTREGSGTSWLPDAAPMRALHFTLGGWGLMVHGVEFLQFDRQLGGDRSASQFGAIGWIMGMATHSVGAGRLSFRGMFSADPWTVGNRGYPEILQTGEAYDGQPLHDYQHPHNLFMELASIYERPLTHDVGLQLYAAPVGEPAVGPPAFPHRPSAENDPFAPLSHHWQDATHISFGVLTAGLFTKLVKLEGSLFNGREPDQHRADIEYTGHSPTLDSYSARLTVNPSAPWSVATWYAYLRSPEQLEPTVSQHRMGVSVLNERPLSSRGHLSSAFIYGANLYSNDARLSNSVLVETNADLDGRNTVFGRAEYVNKSATDLAVTTLLPPADERFNIESIGVGYVRSIASWAAYGTAGLGVEATLDLIPSTLEPVYGTRTPGGFAVFLQLRAGGRDGGMPRGSY